MLHLMLHVYFYVYIDRQEYARKQQEQFRHDQERKERERQARTSQRRYLQFATPRKNPGYYSRHTGGATRSLFVST